MSKNGRQTNDRQLIYYQSVTAALAFCLLGYGVIAYLGEGYDAFWTGMAVRIGATLAVVALAMPQLFQLRKRLPSIFGGIALATLAIIAIRPRVGNVLLGLLVVVVVANGVLRWLTKTAGAAKR